MRIKEEPRYVSLPIQDVKEIRLVGTDAGDGFVAKHINLCNLRLSVTGGLKTRAADRPP